ncbi:MAG: DNA topoisomerase III [Fibrobacter sp.]|jgi:DNA topoisomerase-3|nr:DNA topoisomerase III [Fibrobacter sp.]
MPVKKVIEKKKTLIIAEKPSVAADLVKAIGGNFTKGKTAFESPDYVVSWALGHLVTIADPKEMSDLYKKWTLDTLPILPEKFELKAISTTQAQLSALGKWILSKDVDTIINGCDAGREGELIFHYIVSYVVEGKKTKKSPLEGKKLCRLWMKSMTKSAIQEALAHLRSESEMQNLQDAAISRSEADWLIGINASRGLTAYNSRFGGFQLTPCGRVQTPTLTIIVNREKERLDFQPENFWTIEGAFENSSVYRGKWTDLKENQFRIFDKEKAEAIVRKCADKPGIVEETSKPSTQKCAPLYDLTMLQREANNRFGFSAKTTLQIAQSLYEKHKATTYPRTDSKFLPEDYVEQVKNTLTAMTGELKPFAERALKEGWVIKDYRIFNNKKISDHHAIIPTGVFPKTLTEAERKIFTMICQRFIAVFYPPAQYLITTRITTVENETFKTEGKILTDPGFRAVYGKDADEESMIPPLGTSNRVKTVEMELAEDVTKPPARYTESSLLSVMESAGKLIEDDELRDAMKEHGLGTPATRAAIIEKLIADKYLVREGKELVPTSKAFDLIQIALAMKIQDLTSPELTGEWEYQLGLIEKGKTTREKFIGDIVELTRHMVENIKDFKEDQTRKEASFSPLNGMHVYETVARFDTDNGIQIRKTLGGRRMADDEVAELLTNRKIGPLTGFRSKRGAEFAAALILNDQNKVEFVFENVDANVETGEEIGKSPVDGSPVFDTLTAYISQSAIDKEKTGLRITKIILGKEITKSNMIRLLNGEKTELIQGFRSSKTKRLFDAYLLLDSKGKINFEFPPRAPSAGKRRFFKKKTAE